MNTSTIFIILGVVAALLIAIAGLVLSIMNYIQSSACMKETKRESAELKRWQQGVEHQLGRFDGKIEAPKVMRIEK